MKKRLSIAALLLLSTLPAAAQEWSAGASTGPFVFGDFLERTVRVGTGQGPSHTQTLVLTAGTRAGVAVDVEKSFAPRWAVRLEGTFTRAPLAIKVQDTDGDPLEIDAGELDVSTFTLPLVFRINPHGTFRFHLLGGPALGVYRIAARDNAEGSDATIEGTQMEWGVAAGAGVAWWFSQQFAIEANAVDIITTSPIEREQFENSDGVDIPRPNNFHAAVGVRWRF